MTTETPTPVGPAAAHTASLREVAGLFLRLGTTAFGGPAAHIAMMEDEVVRRRKWLTAEEFVDLVGAAFGHWPLFLVFLKVGSVLFGSGYVLLAFLQRRRLMNHRGESEFLGLLAVVLGTAKLFGRRPDESVSYPCRANSPPGWRCDVEPDHDFVKTAS